MKSNIVKIIYVAINIVMVLFIIVALIHGGSNNSSAIKAAQTKVESLEIQLSYKKEIIDIQSQTLEASRYLLDAANTRSQVIDETEGYKKNLASLENLKSERSNLERELASARREYNQLISKPD